MFEVEIELIKEDKARIRKRKRCSETCWRYLNNTLKQQKDTPGGAGSYLRIEEPGQLTDLVTSHLSLKLSQKQEILEIFDLKERIERLVEILGRELEILEIERKIGSRVRKQMEKTQKEYYLREQIKAIQKELGEKDERMAEIDDYREKIRQAKFPDEVEEKALKELDRLEKMPPAAAEAVVIRNYLDWLIDLPWSIGTEDRTDLDVVQQILDDDHYGLEK